jgi:hypothetical protein
MHRDHVRLPKLLTLQVLALGVFAPVVWSQSYRYAVLVDGSATTCTTMPYSKPGRLHQMGTAHTACHTLKKSSSATSYSTVDLRIDQSVGSVALTAYNSNSSGVARSMTNDTVTLTPPSGYNQNSVVFTVTDEYSLAIDNNGASGYAQLCWTAPKLWAKPQCIQKHKTTEGGEVTLAARLKKSAAGFQFPIAKGSQVAASLKGTGSWDGVYTTDADPDEFEFKQDGWSCTFASGVPCLTKGP